MTSTHLRGQPQTDLLFEILIQECEMRYGIELLTVLTNRENQRQVHLQNIDDIWSKE